MKINIVGFGLMGRQIASLFYLMGYSVNVFSRSEITEKQFLREVKRVGRNYLEVLGTKKGAYNFLYDLSELPNIPTIECVSENIDLKKEIYTKIRQNNESEYFTNTSSFSPSEVADDVMGMHFFNPISLGLVELTSKENKNSRNLNLIIESLSKFGLDVVSTKFNRAYVGNFILFHEISSAFKLVEKYGYTVDSINRVYKKLYGNRDIFNIIDLVGVDVSLQILKNLKEIDSTVYVPKLLEKAMNNNVLGRKNKTSIKSLVDGS